MMKKNISTLDISSTSIKLLSVKGKQIDKWDSISLEPGMVKNGVIQDPEAFGETIDALFASANISKKGVVVTVTGLPFTYSSMEMPKMDRDLVDEAIIRAAKKEMSLPLSDLYLSWQATDIRSTEIDYFVVGVYRNVIDALVQALNGAGIKQWVVDLKPLAIARAASKSTAIIIGMEPDYFDIVLVNNGQISAMHSVTLPKAKMSMEDSIQLLKNELSKTLKYYNTRHPQEKIGPSVPIIVSGELAVSDRNVKHMQDDLGYQVERLSPAIELPPEFPLHSYSTNIGLALKGQPPAGALDGELAAFNDINIDIYTDQAKAKPKTRNFSLVYVIAPALLALTAGILLPINNAGDQSNHEVQSLQNELIAAQQDLIDTRRSVQTLNDEIALLENGLNETALEMQAFQQESEEILGQGNTFYNNLNKVTNALSSETRPNQFVLEKQSITVKGEADDISAILDYAMLLEKEAFPEVRIVEINNVESTEEENQIKSFTVEVTKQ